VRRLHRLRLVPHGGDVHLPHRRHRPRPLPLGSAAHLGFPVVRNSGVNAELRMRGGAGEKGVGFMGEAVGLEWGRRPRRKKEEEDGEKLMAVARLPKILCGFIGWSEDGPARTSVHMYEYHRSIHWTSGQHDKVCKFSHEISQRIDRVHVLTVSSCLLWHSQRGEIAGLQLLNLLYESEFQPSLKLLGPAWNVV
jgi:hypothetical protein